MYNNCCDFIYTFLVSYNAQNIYLVKSLILTLLKVIIGTPPLIMKKKMKKKVKRLCNNQITVFKRNSKLFWHKKS